MSDSSDASIVVTDPPEPPLVKWSDFLAHSAPGAERRVSDMVTADGYGTLWVKTPSLRLFCASPDCEDECFFDCDDRHSLSPVRLSQIWLLYSCRHCNKTTKRYSLLVYADSDRAPAMCGQAIKVGEWPPFGPRIPSRVNSLVGPDREYFFKGIRAEALGMGIGAFGYYRRVVENQKDRIFDEIIRVSRRIGAKPEIIQGIEAAKAETQFSKAVVQIKDGIPEALKIDGHNPLSLLHSALSEGIHSQSDEICLELAIHIRVVLTELADRLGQAMKEHKELESAVSRLLKTKASRPSKSDPSETLPPA